MLSRLHLENFKAFKQPTDVPLAPLTLIFGANSSGKSALIQALALCGQSTNFDYEGRGDNSWSWSGSHVDLGGFRNTVFGHAANETMSIGLEYTHGTQAMDLLRESPETPGHKTYLECSLTTIADSHGFARSYETFISNSEQGFSLSPCESHPKRSRLHINAETFWAIYTSRAAESEDVEVNEGLWDALVEGWSYERIHEEFGDLDDLAEQTKNLVGTNRKRFEELLPILHQAGGVQLASTGFIPQDTFRVDLDWEDYRDYENWREQDWAQITWLNGMCELVAEEVGRWTEPLSSALRDMTFLGPIRAEPQRIEDLHLPEEVGSPSDGRGTTGRLFRYPELKERVNESFRMLEIPYEIDAVEITNDDYPTVGEFLALQLVDLRTNIPVSLADVGYGISQLLPIVAEAASESQGPLLIEQPELHLHPRLQGKLAELLAEVSGRKEKLGSLGELSVGRQIIAETHSESMVLRLQTLIRRGDLDPSDVAVIYVGSDDGEGSGSWIHPIEFGSTGEMLQEWPGGFFEDRLEDY